MIDNQEFAPNILVTDPGVPTVEQETFPLIETGIASLPSLKHDAHNEDAAKVFGEKGVAGIFDGMSSGQKGAESKLLAALLLKDPTEGDTGTLLNLPDVATPKEMRDLLRRSVESANNESIIERDRRIYAIALRNEYPFERDAWGSTLDVGKIHKSPDGQWYYTFAHTGDGSQMIIRNGKIIYLTEEHDLLRLIHEDATPIHRPLKAYTTCFDFYGEIDWPNEEKVTALRQKLRRAKSKNDLNPEEEFYFQRRHALSTWTGSKKFKVDVESIALLPGDIVMLSSDGPTDNLTEQEILDIIGTEDGSSAQANAEKVVEEARKSSNAPRNEDNIRPKPDDMSFIIMKPKIS